MLSHTQCFLTLATYIIGVNGTSFGELFPATDSYIFGSLILTIMYMWKQYSVSSTESDDTVPMFTINNSMVHLCVFDHFRTKTSVLQRSNLYKVITICVILSEVNEFQAVFFSWGLI